MCSEYSQATRIFGAERIRQSRWSNHNDRQGSCDRCIGNKTMPRAPDLVGEQQNRNHRIEPGQLPSMCIQIIRRGVASCETCLLCRAPSPRLPAVPGWIGRKDAYFLSRLLECGSRLSLSNIRRLMLFLAWCVGRAQRKKSRIPGVNKRHEE